VAAAHGLRTHRTALRSLRIHAVPKAVCPTALSSYTQCVEQHKWQRSFLDKHAHAASDAAHGRNIQGTAVKSTQHSTVQTLHPVLPPGKCMRIGTAELRNAQALNSRLFCKWCCI